MFSNSSLHSMTDPMCFVQMIHNYMEHLERTKHQHAAAAAEPADTGANTSVRIRWVCIPHLQFLIFQSYYPSAAQKLPSRLFGGYVQVILQPWVAAIQCSVSSTPTHISFCLARGNLVALNEHSGVKQEHRLKPITFSPGPFNETVATGATFSASFSIYNFRLLFIYLFF